MSYTYQHFWKLRGTAAFWLTTHFGYRPGAALALVAAKLRLSPNLVSASSFFVALLAVLPLGMADWGRVTQGVWLGAFLLFAYWLDCADGLLARGTGQTSSFGAVLDKTVDMAVAVMTGSVMGLAALGHSSWWIPESWQVVILPLTLFPRAAFSVLNWLKDAEIHQTNRLRAVGAPQGLKARARRIVGNLLDDVAIRTGAAVAWCLGAYWEYALVLSGTFSILLLGYLVKSKRDFDLFDKEKKVAVM